MLPAYEYLLASQARDKATLRDNAPAGQVEGVVRELAALRTLLDEQFVLIGDRLALLATHSRNFGSAGGQVLAVRRSDGSYDVRESQIVAEIADSHLALSSSLHAASQACRTHFGEVETAVILCALAENHKKDATTLRALLWEDKKS